MNYKERLDWLEQDSERLEDVRGYFNNSDNEGITVRLANRRNG